MTLRDQFLAVRSHTDALSSVLSAEDQTVQSMPDCSPTKWHRAHTTWFFETVVLERAAPDYQPFNPLYRGLFNSYYQAVGPQYPRAARGAISRPGIDEIADYRAHVDRAMLAVINSNDDSFDDLIELGLHHEQQHQELLLMDINHAMSLNPLRPSAYADHFLLAPAPTSTFVPFESGMTEAGSADGFCFDNEQPRHPVYLGEFSLATSLVSNASWLEFMDAGGYERPELWLSEGWAWVQREQVASPMYWSLDGNEWLQHSLAGTAAVDRRLPVTHISFYEADAFARFSEARLPTEFEWEHAITSAASEFNGVFDACWQWTASAYLPYPGFRPREGVISEYNGKFMASQMVLRGASAFTPPGHARASYRNFFYPASRWMLSGLRLAR